MSFEPLNLADTNRCEAEREFGYTWQDPEIDDGSPPELVRPRMTLRTAAKVALAGFGVGLILNRLRH